MNGYSTVFNRADPRRGSETPLDKRIGGGLASPHPSSPWAPLGSANPLSESVIRCCLDSEGNEATKPMRLDGIGAQLAVDAALSAAVYDFWDIYEDTTFATLSLDLR